MSTENPLKIDQPVKVATPTNTPTPDPKLDAKPLPTNNINFAEPENPKEAAAAKATLTEQFKDATVIQARFPAVEIKIKHTLKKGESLEQGLSALKDAIWAAMWGKKLPDGCIAESVHGADRDPSRLAAFLDGQIDGETGVCECRVEAY
jgi:hypothetical protein